MFFMERVVLYPAMPLMRFGLCFHIILPPISIVIGMSKSQININHQNHIKSTSINSDLLSQVYHISQ